MTSYTFLIIEETINTFNAHDSLMRVSHYGLASFQKDYFHIHDGRHIFIFIASCYGTLRMLKASNGKL